LTAEQVMELDVYCRERFVELVPNQNSFGHMHRWLKHEPYAHLAETHSEFRVPWGTMEGPFSLSPAEPGSVELLRGLYDELLPNFTSRRFNVGCDETFDVGAGKSRALCEERGEGRVYLDFLTRIHREVARRGYTMQFWGDVMVQYPELLPELPQDVVALAWGYEAEHPFDRHAARFAAADVPYYVCPGTSSWRSVAGRTENALANLRNAAENGLAYGAAGYLNTDWGDCGHWQHLPVSFLGFAVGAAYAWCLRANEGIDVAPLVSRFAFDDPTGVVGHVAYDLGNLYRLAGPVLPNSSVLFWILQQEHIDRYDECFEVEDLRTTLEAIDAAVAPLDGARMERADAPLVQREFRNAARLLRHACRHALWRMEGDGDAAALAADLEAILEAYEELWLSRHRPGGLEDSLARFEKLRAAYRDN
jgi:hypothetical protein